MALGSFAAVFDDLIELGRVIWSLVFAARFVSAEFESARAARRSCIGAIRRFCIVFIERLVVLVGCCWALRKWQVCSVKEVAWHGGF